MDVHTWMVGTVGEQEFCSDGLCVSLFFSERLGSGRRSLTKAAYGKPRRREGL